MGWFRHYSGDDRVRLVKTKVQFVHRLQRLPDRFFAFGRFLNLAGVIDE